MRRTERDRERERGTASLEALMVLPLFLVLWIGIHHMNRVHAGVLATRGQARSCAWRYSNGGCRGELPAECSAAGSESEANEAEQSMLDAAMQNSVLRWAFEGIVGASVNVQTSREVTQHAMFGEGPVNVGSSLYLLCNERNRTMTEIGHDTTCSMLSEGSLMHTMMACGGGG
jgi:hypothetical protein